MSGLIGLAIGLAVLVFLLARAVPIWMDRCNFYKATQPVERACAPEMVRQLKERGYESIRAPLPIVDSFVPPDFCTAFHLDRRRLRAGGVPWPDARRVALLRVLAPPSDSGEIVRRTCGR